MNTAADIFNYAQTHDVNLIAVGNYSGESLKQNLVVK